MAEITIRLVYEMDLSYDPNSDAFKEAYESYKEVCNRNASIEDMLKNVAYNVQRRGADEMVEGVGYVDVQGRDLEGKFPYSGITVEDDDPTVEYEID